MRILHTSDLHLGQTLYQNYGRTDEHEHYFRQLEDWCSSCKPDALVVSGDIYDVPQPSAAVRSVFTEHFVRLHDACPAMKIIITAGNHDSASRLQAESLVWDRIGVRIIGMPPSADAADGTWEDDYIVRLGSGYVIALPYMNGSRREQLQKILDRVSVMNTGGMPVVMTAHTAVTGGDFTGHGFEIGSLKTQDLSEMGTGWDYLALGHIHKPQTLGRGEDRAGAVTFPAPVARYSGSALHVSCDETYPHSVSLVDIDRHGGSVRIEALRIDELRHFHILPSDGTAFRNAEDAIMSVRKYAEGEGGYFRLRFDCGTVLPSNFCQGIYDAIGSNEDKARFNPRIIWDGVCGEKEDEKKAAAFEIADLQQMTDPVLFIEKTVGQYQGLDLDTVREAFGEVLERVRKNAEDEAGARIDRKSRKSGIKSEDQP